MTDPEKVYTVLAEHKRGVFSDTLALLAEIDAKHISSLVGKAQQYCSHGKKIEGETTCPGGIWQTRYRIVADYNAGPEQMELVEGEVGG